jgi:hypothetical protein
MIALPPPPISTAATLQSHVIKKGCASNINWILEFDFFLLFFCGCELFYWPQLMYSSSSSSSSSSYSPHRCKFNQKHINSIQKDNKGHFKLVFGSGNRIDERFGVLIKKS